MSDVTVTFTCDPLTAQEMIVTYALLDHRSVVTWVEYIKYCSVLDKFLEILPAIVATADEKGQSLPEYFRDVSERVEKELVERAVARTAAEAIQQATEDMFNTLKDSSELEVH
jgi:hypothetical protein